MNKSRNPYTISLIHQLHIGHHCVTCIGLGIQEATVLAGVGLSYFSCLGIPLHPTQNAL